jgi:hypothetical protein
MQPMISQRPGAPSGRTQMYHPTAPSAPENGDLVYLSKAHRFTRFGLNAEKQCRLGDR